MKMLKINFPLINKIRRNCPHFQTKEIFYLRGEDDQSDTTGESNDQWIGNKFNNRSQSCDAHDDKHNIRHESCDDQAIHAMRLYYAINDHDECSCRATDLYTASSQ